MPKQVKSKHEQMLVRMADRFALVLCYLDAKEETIAPFNDDDFWMSDDAFEIRAMPNYQEMLDKIRVMAA